MKYRKEINCEMCGKIIIAKTHNKIFCGACKKANKNNWCKIWLKNPINKAKHKQCVENWRLQNPESRIISQRKYSKKHPEVIKAHNMSQKIPIKTECQICKNKLNLQKHHWRYDKPFLISTLCKDCHSIQHIKNRRYR